MSAGSISNVFIGGILLSPVTNGNLLSTIFGCFLSLITSSSPLFTILGCFLSCITGDSLLFAVSGCYWFFLIGSGPLSIVLSYLLSLDIDDDFLYNVLVSGFLSLMFFIGSWALFLTSIPSCVRYSFLFFSSFFSSFLSSLPILLIRNPAPLTEKRLFD